MKIQDLLTDESKWTKDVMARDAQGEFIFWLNNRAVCWCLVGALSKCYKDKVERFGQYRRLSRAVKDKGYLALSAFNDDPKTTFQDVRRLIERLDV